MSALTTLAGTEVRLLTREWAAMVFAFAFPPLFMLVLAGVFGTEDDMGGTGVSGTDYYIAAYMGVPMAALALVGLPVMLASYRERDVLRRFEAFGVPTGRVVLAQAVVTAGLIVVAAGLVVATAAPIYGLPAVEDPLGVAAGFAAGTVTMLALGVALGLLVPTARAAQALGMLVFMPMWLLGGGGPPRDIMSGPMANISDVLPLWHATSSIREPWLNGSGATDHVLALMPWFVAGLVAVAILLRRRDSRV
jgi:ABC-2 type transport system permease protein